MNLIEQLEKLPRTHMYNHERQDGSDEAVCTYVKLSDLRAIIEQAKREAVNPVAIDSGYIEGTAERLRLICSKLGIGAPESNEELMLCQFSIFGLIRGKIDAIYKTQPDHTKLIGELVESFPMQPIVIAQDGVIRFKENRIVNVLLDKASKAGYSLNEISCGDFTQEEHMQLAQLIGYSVSGYGNLSYASDASVAKADETADALLTKARESIK